VKNHVHRKPSSDKVSLATNHVMLKQAVQRLPDRSLSFRPQAYLDFSPAKIDEIEPHW
jgi:hypothetical protein